MKKAAIGIGALLTIIIGILIFQTFTVSNNFRSLGYSLASSLQFMQNAISGADSNIPEISTAQINTENSPFMGNKKAPIRLILFSDFECPFCKEFQKKIIPKLKTNYIDKGLLCIYYKHFPLDFHKQAFPAAKAAYAASLQGKFWEMADKLISTNLNAKSIRWSSIAKFAGIPDLDAFENARISRETEIAVWEDLDEGALVPVTGTPTYIINDNIYEGLPFDQLVMIIDEALLLAQSRIQINEVSGLISQNAQLLDVRTPSEFNAGHIEKAQNIDINDPDFPKKVRSLDRSRQLIVYCKAGKRSDKAFPILNSLGFTNVKTLDGGVEAWQKAGLRLVEKIEESPDASRISP